MSAGDGRERPRVLYLINAFEAGGAEAGLVRLVRGGLFDGFDLTVAGLAAGEPEVRAELERTGVQPLMLTSAPKPQVRDLPRLFAEVVRLARRLRPDVMILSLPQANLLGRLTSLVWRPPVVVSFEHNVRLAKRAYEVLFWLTSPLVDWMFADARATAREAARRFYIRPPGRTSVVPLVSLPDMEAAPAPPDRFTVVNAARFTPPKNQAALIRAVAILRERGIDVDLVLYGQGPERDACEALAASLGVADRVRLPGFVPDWPTRPASVFVLASRHEGLCMALLEAMHAGLPVATPLVGGVADYATPETALILPDVEPATLAAAIETLRDDPGAPARAEVGRARVRGAYGETAVAARLRELNAELHAAVRAFPSPPAPIRR
jgi:glycosyltransferase involved in cell wall biosynthesis